MAGAGGPGLGRPGIPRPAVDRRALRERLPSSFASLEAVSAGGLPAYGLEGKELWALFGRSMGQVNQILRGARPGELPVERPGRYQLAVNRRTAGALGLTIAQSVLQRADQVIE